MHVCSQEKCSVVWDERNDVSHLSRCCMNILVPEQNQSGRNCINTMTVLTHWGRVTHICVGKLTIIGSDNGLSPGRRQAIIWNNAGILLIGPSGTNFSEILFGIQTFSFRKMHLKMSSAKWRPFCLGLNVLMHTRFTRDVVQWVIPLYASVTSHSRAPYGLFPGCFAQKSYIHSRGPHGPRAAPYTFCLPVRARRVLMHAI